MLSISGLTVRFGDLTAVDDLSLEVPEGSIYGLLGPNGAGKTTTISCLAGLREPDAGQITIDGIDVLKNRTEAQRRLGVVPQMLAIYDALKVVDNLRFFGALYGLGGRALKDRVAWGLALAQLDEKADARVETLSGGMKRRLNMACSLLHDPKLVVCDEPTTGVDPQSRNHIFETLRALVAEGRTLVFTTHYMEEVEALCSRVAIVDHGRIIADDALDTLVSDGQTLEGVFLELTGRALRDG